MNVVDSSGWLEYFADGPNADFFAPAIEATSELIIPAISIYDFEHIEGVQYIAKQGPGA